MTTHKLLKAAIFCAIQTMRPGTQKFVPSGGCCSFLCAGAAMYLFSRVSIYFLSRLCSSTPYLLISMSMVSIVKSRFHWLIEGSFVRSTLPFL